MTALMAGVGVLIIVLGLAVSIALHEVGHLVPAKLFKVRVTQYMVGFGPTLFSRTRGETEYGVKAIPLGGYVAMIGMYPEPQPQHAAAPADPPATVHSHSTGLFQQMSQDAREVAAEQLRPGDENRMFYRLATWKKIIIMLGGPAMNGLIALALTAGTISLHGTNTPTTQVAEVFECITAVEVEEADSGVERDTCTDQDPEAPAYAAGLLPGDTIVEFGGQRVETWDELTPLIQQAAGDTVNLTYLRGGEQATTEITPLETERPVIDALGRIQRDGDGAVLTEPVGFIGMGAEVEIQQQPPWEAGPLVWEQTKAIGEIVMTLPVRMYDVAVSTFTAADRDPDGPMSVVGVGRIAGELSAQEQIPWESRFASLMTIIAAVNLALMVFNLIPLLPLDGGHVAGALYEALRRRMARLLGRPDPGPFDISRLLPLTYVVAALLLGMGAMLILADIVNPIRLFE